MKGEIIIKKLRIVISLLFLIIGLGSVDAQAKTEEAGMKILPVKENIKLAASQTTFNTSKYKSIEEAADKVREKVVNHRSNVSVFFKTTIASPTKAYEQFKLELTKDTDDSGAGDYLYWDIKAETPKYAYTTIIQNGKSYYYYEFNIQYYYYTTLAQKKKVDSKVKKIINSFGFTDSTSNYKKIKTVYDYVCKNVKYADDLSNDISYTSYSALFYGKAVCQGYAQLIYKMLKEVDVPVRLIPGYAGGELHGWNIVKIGKYYYNIDATWDATHYQRGQKYKNFLIGDNFANHVRFTEYQTDDFYGKYPMAQFSYATGKREYSTKSERAMFKVKKPKIKKINGKKVTLKKVDSGVKYTIQYSNKRSFKGAKKVTTKKTKINLSKLNKNNKYYVRFRASKVIDGKTVYTKWSVKKVIVVY